MGPRKNLYFRKKYGSRNNNNNNTSYNTRRNTRQPRNARTNSAIAKTSRAVAPTRVAESLNIGCCICRIDNQSPDYRGPCGHPMHQRCIYELYKHFKQSCYLSSHHGVDDILSIPPACPVCMVTISRRHLPKLYRECKFNMHESAPLTDSDSNSSQKKTSYYDGTLYDCVKYRDRYKSALGTLVAKLHTLETYRLYYLGKMDYFSLKKELIELGHNIKRPPSHSSTSSQNDNNTNTISNDEALRQNSYAIISSSFNSDVDPYSEDQCHEPMLNQTTSSQMLLPPTSPQSPPPPLPSREQQQQQTELIPAVDDGYDRIYLSSQQPCCSYMHGDNDNAAVNRSSSSASLFIQTTTSALSATGVGGSENNLLEPDRLSKTYDLNDFTFTSSSSSSSSSSPSPRSLNDLSDNNNYNILTSDDDSEEPPPNHRGTSWDLDQSLAFMCQSPVTSHQLEQDQQTDQDTEANLNTNDLNLEQPLSIININSQFANYEREQYLRSHSIVPYDNNNENEDDNCSDISHDELQQHFNSNQQLQSVREEHEHGYEFEHNNYNYINERYKQVEQQTPQAQTVSLTNRAICYDGSTVDNQSVHHLMSLESFDLDHSNRESKNDYSSTTNLNLPNINQASPSTSTAVVPLDYSFSKPRQRQQQQHHQQQTTSVSSSLCEIHDDNPTPDVALSPVQLTANIGGRGFSIEIDTSVSPRNPSAAAAAAAKAIGSQEQQQQLEPHQFDLVPVSCSSLSSSWSSVSSYGNCGGGGIKDSQICLRANQQRSVSTSSSTSPEIVCQLISNQPQVLLQQQHQNRVGSLQMQTDEPIESREACRLRHQQLLRRKQLLKHRQRKLQSQGGVVNNAALKRSLSLLSIKVMSNCSRQNLPTVPSVARNDQFDSGSSQELATEPPPMELGHVETNTAVIEQTDNAADNSGKPACRAVKVIGYCGRGKSMLYKILWTDSAITFNSVQDCLNLIPHLVKNWRLERRRLAYAKWSALNKKTIKPKKK